MAVTEPSRHHMVEVLVERLGEEAAMTLVEHLPPVGWADVATRHDVEALRRELLGELHTGLADVRSVVHDRSADTMRTLVLGFVGALTANTAIILTAIGFAG